MIQIRRSDERGHADHGWLNSYHTFSFGTYRDKNHIGFRTLRVMNEDRVAANNGFGTHSHDNMEIVSYVLSGQLEHQDSMGNGAILTPGEFQRMSAGSGIQHSEFNPSTDTPAHFYQIWLKPTERDIPPSYQQKRFANDELANQLRLVASPNAEQDSLAIHSDARIYVSKLTVGAGVASNLIDSRHGWLQVLEGRVALNGVGVGAGDGAAISEESAIEIMAAEDSQVMLFDLP